MGNLQHVAMAWVSLSSSSAAAAAVRHTAFYPGKVWTDVNGDTIDAHGAGMLSDGGKVYWYGSQRHGHPDVPPKHAYPTASAYCYPIPNSTGPASGRHKLDSNQMLGGQLLGDGFTEGVNLYVSDGDLYNWRPAGLVFLANQTGAHCLERPKVIKCPGTGRYVLWAKGFAPPRGEVKQAVVATADSPLGPFQLVDSQRIFYSPAGTQMADATLYVDGDETWLFWRTVTNTTGVDEKGGFMVAKLNRECTALESETGATRIADIRHEVRKAVNI